VAKDPKTARLRQDKENTIENLETIQMTLTECINEGMLDEEDHFYNEILVLLDEAVLIKTYPELAEVVSKGQTLETDIDAWLALHQRETLSIVWPKI
jgi:hypothetical protein